MTTTRRTKSQRRARKNLHRRRPRMTARKTKKLPKRERKVMPRLRKKQKKLTRRPLRAISLGRPRLPRQTSLKLKARAKLTSLWRSPSKSR